MQASQSAGARGGQFSRCWCWEAPEELEAIAKRWARSAERLGLKEGQPQVWCQGSLLPICFAQRQSQQVVLVDLQHKMKV